MVYSKNKSHIAFWLFLIVYSLSASDWALPGSGTLRWVSIGILALIGLLQTNIHNIILWPNEFYYMFFVYVIGIIPSEDNLLVGIERAVSFFLLIAGLTLYIRRNKIESENIFRYFEIFSKVILTLIVIMTFLYFLKGGEYGNYRGIYANKNYLVPIASTALAVALFWVIKSDGYKKILYAFCFLCSLFVIVCTGSRAGIVCALAVIFSIPLITNSTKSLSGNLKIMGKMLLVFAVVITVLMIFDIPALDRLFADESKNGATGFSRGELWKNALVIFKEKPVLGWGNSATYYNTFISTGSKYMWGIHNSYLMILIDYGIVGTLLHIMFFLTYIRLNYKRYKKAVLSEEEKIFVKILCVIQLSLMIDAVAESFLFAVGNFASVCFWLNVILLDHFLMLKIKE